MCSVTTVIIVTGMQSFMLYSTESEIRGFSLAHTERDALAPISKISLASAVDFHAGDKHVLLSFVVKFHICSFDT